MTYFLFGKAFENQIKTIEVQGQKQISAIKVSRKQLANTSTNAIVYRNELLISKERKIFKNIYNKRIDKIEELANKVNYDD